MCASVVVFQRKPFFGQKAGLQMVSLRARHLLIFGLFVAGLFAGGPAVAQNSAAAAPVRLTLPEIVDNMAKTNAERNKDLEHYQGKREYELDYKGFPKDLHADMVVLVSYNAPSTVEFTEVSQSGSKLILNRVIKPIMETEQESMKPANHSRVQVTADNYNFTLLDDPESNGCPYVLGVEPKAPNKFLFRGKIWVDGKDFAVCRIEAEPAKNPSFWIKSTAIHHSFMKVEDFWLPAENNSASNIRLGGRATLTIKYEDYQVQPAPGLQAIANLPTASH
jgi:outer membrane lipoprotein-sorting protein